MTVKLTADALRSRAIMYLINVFVVNVGRIIETLMDVAFASSAFIKLVNPLRRIEMIIVPLRAPALTFAITTYTTSTTFAKTTYTTSTSTTFAETTNTTSSIISKGRCIRERIGLVVIPVIIPIVVHLVIPDFTSTKSTSTTAKISIGRCIRIATVLITAPLPFIPTNTTAKILEGGCIRERIVLRFVVHRSTTTRSLAD
mmetsp:Transcript_15739/g.28593  ORF Transcript_15739/g.28593 Transcript_15739/m.28593 type:complete len:200 (-) Transcript_15739:1403-2002(-)